MATLVLQRCEKAAENRIAYLAVTGDSNYEAFDIYFSLLFPQNSTVMHFFVMSWDHVGVMQLVIKCDKIAKKTEKRR
jgi:hypothetical protein